MRVSRLPPAIDLRVVVLGTLGALLIASYVALAARAPAGIGPFGSRTDTLAFYCGARVASMGADPYRAEPLRTCEQQALRGVGISPVPNLVVPAPLPGYDFALLAPLGFQPYRAALATWYAVLLTSVVITVVLLQRLTGLRPFVVALPLFGAEAYASITLGQIVPLVLLALVASAMALRAGHESRAAFFAALTLVEPHLGIPVVLGLALYVPRGRLVLAVAAIALGALSLATLGFARNVEYFAAALPAQARGEGLEFHRQYSLSAVLHIAGLSAETAVRVGSFSYAATLVFGLWLARRCREAFDEPAMLVFVPIAAALVGGAYAHIAQMAAAVPLALLLVARTSGLTRRWAVCAACCLAVPWQTILSEPTVVAFFPSGAYIDPAPLLARVSDGWRLAQEPWDAWISTIGNRDHRTAFEIFLGKLPTWFGLVTCITLALRAANQVERNRRAPRYRLRKYGDANDAT